MLWKLTFDYNKYDQIDYERVKALWPSAPEEKPANYWNFPEGPNELSDLQVMELLQIPFAHLEVVAYPKAMIVKMQNDERWVGSEKVTPEDLARGRAVQITIPDIGLMVINEVTHLDDCCTDELQKHLDCGWRLLAVCPPNAQRRPDYILGRTVAVDKMGRR